MGMHPHGRARVNPNHPEAFAHCNHCYDLVNHVDLQPQFAYAGSVLVNTGWLVCSTCLDIPNPQNKTLVLPPDPVPIKNPRPGDTSLWTNYLVTDAGDYFDDDEGDDIVVSGGNG